MEGRVAQQHLDRLRAAVENYPRSAGVYIMKDASNKALYIGKAVDLRSRIKSYLFGRDDRMQVPALMARLHHIEWIATANESEALILEANLVRKNKPRYNIDLKDDKHYPYLKVTVNEDFPRLIIVRRVHKDGGRYFGPYTDVASMKRVLSAARKAFQICDCRRIVKPDPNIRPCINYEMGRCGGACAGKISREEYAENINLLLSFLAGRRSAVIGELQQRMEREAAALRFEVAAQIRDRIDFIKTVSRRQNVDLRSTDTNLDAFGIWDNGREICLCVLCFREGLLMSKRHFRFRREEWEICREGRDALVLQYYQDTVGELPGEVLLPAEAGCNRELLEQWFSSATNRRVNVTIPHRGQKCDLIEMAVHNARLYLMQKLPADRRDDLLQLQRVLCLPRYPRVIEAFDISNLGGSFAVAAMVRFVDGVPDKGAYRRFRIRSVEGQDDFAMIMEAVTRRLSRLNEEKKEFADLLLIDGGKGQLNAALNPLRRFENPPMVVSLAKEREEIFSPYVKEAVRLPATHPARKYMQRIRDEAHRYAVAFHRAIRDRQFSRSGLEDVPGIGPARARSLVRRFGSLEGLRRAAAGGTEPFKGLSSKTAANLKKWLFQ